MRYRMFTSSSPGSKYIEKGWECQDNSDKLELTHTQVIAVADGHGSSDCFRSEFGSDVAIKTVFLQTQLYCETNYDESGDPFQFSETGIANFKYSIWQEWRKSIKMNWDDHLKNQKSLGEDEIRFESVSEKYKKRFTSNDESVVEQYLYTAYGTTLLFAVLIESQMLIVQIGDGTCVILQKNGEYHTPVPADEDNFLNVTVSLSEEDANLKMRHIVIDCADNLPTSPLAIFLSTDGVDDCYPLFKNEQHLYKLYTVILDNILKFGYEATETEIIDDLLPGMTAKGSHDDISLAFFITEDIDMLHEVYKCIDPTLKPQADSSDEYDIDDF